MAKLKLPFELEKPSPNEYVTQASEVGYSDDSLKTALDVLFLNKAKTNDFLTVIEQGFYIVDSNFNVGFAVTQDGVLDALGLGYNINSYIENLFSGDISDISAAVEQCTEIVEELQNTVSQIPISNVEQDGINITDKSGNIIWYFRAYVTNENGVYGVDESGNIGFQIVDGKFVFIQDSPTPTPTPTPATTTDSAIIYRANKALERARSINKQTNDMYYSLLGIKESNGMEKTIALNNVGTGKVMVKVAMHYGTAQYTSIANDIFWGGDCRNDFSDVRFFDSNGNILKAELGEPMNMDFLFDSKLNIVKKNLSDGTLVGYNDGVCLSSDNGNTWTTIQGTDIAGQASSVYGRRYMYPVFVDSNDNIYAYRGGKLYKIVAADNYTTINEVLDFSWENNGTTIYPDIQNHAMDEDNNGNLFVGACYQVPFHTSIYKSSDGGDTFALSWASWDAEHSATYSAIAQHVHHIHADRFTGAVYVGIDDYATTYSGPIILKTTDGGTTWEDITADKYLHGCDYYPTYFGQGYRLGGGECYGTGGNTLLRSEDDADFDVIIKGYSGIRSFGDFGNDSVIVAGLQYNDYVSENQIIVSYDKGKTWVTAFRKDVYPVVSSGAGFRDALCLTMVGENEPCILMCHDFANLNAMRIYHGGNHYYREAYILIENNTSSNITITAKSGYAVSYPYSTLKGVELPSLVYRIKLDEGAGNSVCDSLGNVRQISGEYDWEQKEEPVRFGEYGGVNRTEPSSFSSALKLNSRNVLNFGRIKELSFKKNYSVSFWLNSKEIAAENENHTLRDNVTRKLLSFGAVDVYVRNAYIGVCARNTTDVTPSTMTGVGRMQMANYSNNYLFVVIEVMDGDISISLNGCLINSSEYNNCTTINDVDLCNADFCVGSSTNDMYGYISDICVYNKLLSQSEVISLYKGYNIQNS